MASSVREYSARSSHTTLYSKRGINGSKGRKFAVNFTKLKRKTSSAFKLGLFRSRLVLGILAILVFFGPIYAFMRRSTLNASHHLHGGTLETPHIYNARRSAIRINHFARRCDYATATAPGKFASIVAQHRTKFMCNEHERQNGTHGPWLVMACAFLSPKSLETNVVEPIFWYADNEIRFTHCSR